MKTSTGEYSFSKAELKVLKEIASGNHELSTIQDRLAFKPSLLTYALKKLQNKRLIKTTHNGIKKQAYFSDTKHATALRELLMLYDFVDWENVLSGKSIEILFQVLDNIKKSSNIPRNTLWRHTKNWKSRGLITQEGKINHQFNGLSEFLKVYQAFFVNKIANSLSDNSVLLWQQDMTFLVRVPKTAKPRSKDFHKTSLSVFVQYGLPLFADFDIYFYSTSKKAIKPEDAIIHTLLVEPGSVRYTTYALLLLKKTEKQIDKTYLLQEAERLALKTQVMGMLQFLETHKPQEGQQLPTWREFVEKANDYGVTVR